MKYIILFILLLWIARRAIRIFSVVSQDQGGSGTTSGPNQNPPNQPSKDQEGEYIDFEEVD